MVNELLFVIVELCVYFEIYMLFCYQILSYIIVITN